jgi:plastocyanin
LIVSTENKSSALNASQSDNASMINETSQEQSGQKNYTIEIINFSFEPKELVIKKGDTVKWINKDNSAHTITSDTGNELGSGALIKNETYEHKFSFDGIYNYHCSFHQNTMKGKIIVEI